MPEKLCFVIAPIGEPDSDTRKRSDTVLKYVIEPPCQEQGYEVVRADKISQPGLITMQVIEKVLNAELVVADLTEHNPNVFYELAVRHAARKHIIHLIAEGEKIPFDLSDYRTIRVNHQDLAVVASAKDEIRNQIREIEGGAPVQTPIQVAIMVEQLKGGNQTDSLLEQVLLGLQDMSQGVKTLVKESEEKRSIWTLTDGKVMPLSSLLGRRGFAGIPVPPNTTSGSLDRLPPPPKTTSESVELPPPPKTKSGEGG